MTHIRSLFFNGPLSEVGNKTREAFQLGRPSEIIWNITNKCNLLCQHCYLNADCHRAANELSSEEALDLVRRMGEVKVPLLFLTGGEPFLRKDLFAILAEAKKQGIRTVISTNGTLIDDAAADKLVEYGVDYVAISLYGPEKFHDQYVMVPGTFKRVVTAIERLQKRGIKIGIKTTVNAATFPHFFDLIQVAKDLGAKLVYPCDLISTGRAVSLNHQRITAEQWRQIADYMLEDVLRNEEGIEYDIGAMPSIAAYLAERLQEKGYNVQEAFSRLRIKSACPVGKGLMGIDSEGNVLPCSFLQDYHVGNIREISLTEAFARLLPLGQEPVSGKCSTCKYSQLCRGCRAKAFHATGNIYGEDFSCLLNGSHCRCEAACG